MTRSTADGPPDPVDHDLRRLVDGDRREQAAAVRRREHWLRTQGEQSGSLAGILADLGERGDPVTIGTIAGPTVVGEIDRLGTDFVALRSVARARVVVALAAMAWLRADRDHPTITGVRPRGTGLDLSDWIREAAVTGPEVAIHVMDRTTVTGRLRFGGQDVLAIAVGTPASPLYVPIRAVAVLSIR